MQKQAHRRRLAPEHALVLSFLTLIGIGTFLLSLPAAAKGAPLGTLDAFFTATSATCVTGLIVVDTATRLSAFGQTVVLVLLQIGGLGIMTFSVFFVLAIGGRTSIRDRLLMQGTLSPQPSRDLWRVVKGAVIMTFLVEAVGALVLWVGFLGQHKPGKAALMAGFHSVSAFCNAGFSLYSDGLIRHQSNLLVNVCLIVLIVVGGLGFTVLTELRFAVLDRFHRRRHRSFSLHTRVVVWATLALIGVGALVFFLAETGHSLDGKGTGTRVLSSLFQSVTTRTAGFNTVDLAALRPATLLFLCLLMFVGASPGSTGGGLKTTTLAVVLAMAWSRLRGRDDTLLLGRRIPSPTVNRALGVVLLAAAVSVVAVVALLFTEQHMILGPEATKRPLDIIFEVVSALGTVGLSNGVTPLLSPEGKVIVAVLMFLGRVGPLTVALAVGRSAAKGRFSYAEENVMVG